MLPRGPSTASIHASTLAAEQAASVLNKTNAARICKANVERVDDRVRPARIRREALPRPSSIHSSLDQSATLAGSYSFSKTSPTHVDVEHLLGLEKHRLAIKNTRPLSAVHLFDRSEKEVEIRQAVLDVARRPTRLTQSELRRALRASNDFQMQRPRSMIIRHEMRHCMTSKDVLTLAGMVFQHRELATEFALQQETLRHTVYRCRRTTSDRELANMLMAIVACFERDSIPVPYNTICLLVRFAARGRDLDLMWRALRRQKLMQGTDREVSSHEFKRTMAKFSLGHRNLGAIRNGDWHPDDLLQILTGFRREKHLPVEQQCHMETFLRREYWSFWHCWLAALAACQASDLLWKEWTEWSTHYNEHMPRGISSTLSPAAAKHSTELWFVEQMALSGDVQRAWEIVRHTGADFATLKSRAQVVLLSGVQYAGNELSRTRQVCLEQFGIDICASDGRSEPDAIRDPAYIPSIDDVSREQVSKVSAILLTTVGRVGKLRRFFDDSVLPPPDSDYDPHLEDGDDREDMLDEASDDPLFAAPVESIR